jgi:hypothetical protein
MFLRIKSDDLVPGTKYKIGEFNGIFRKKSWLQLELTHGTIDDLYLEFDNVKRGNLRNWRRFFSPMCDFYKFVSNNPQWQMERRSVNLFLKKLTGDDCFEW